MLSKKTVSVIVLIEGAPEGVINDTIQNVISQTHKSLDLIVATHPFEDLAKIQDRWRQINNLSWAVTQEPGGLSLLQAGQKLIKGEYVFYRTTGPASWFPRHIEHHLDLFAWDKKAQWSHSIIEYHNLAEQQNPFNIVNFRLERPPNLDTVIVDEICHSAELQVDWTTCLKPGPNGQQRFFPGAVFEIFKGYRLAVPEEITISQWVDPRPQQPILCPPKSSQNVEEEVIEMPNGQLGVKIQYPTIMGNMQWIEHNKLVFDQIKALDPLSIKKIAIKRTIGMGDVILVEPVIRALRQKYSNAEITMFTGATRGAREIVAHFNSRPDVIIGDLEEQKIMSDYLYDQKGYDLRFDFDLAYESRRDINYIDAYFLTAGFVEEVTETEKGLRLVNPVPNSERAPRLVYEEPRMIVDKYVSVSLEGSGWPGKEWEVTRWIEVLKNIKAMGYKLAFVSGGGQNQSCIGMMSKLEIDRLASLTLGEGDGIFLNGQNDFNIMLNYLRYAEFHVGVDNGPMHIAAAFGNKSFIVAGAALPSMTSRSSLIWQVTNEKLSCLHCKGRQFYNPAPSGITFVAMCENMNDTYACMTKLDTTRVVDQFNKFYQISNFKV